MYKHNPYKIEINNASFETLIKYLYEKIIFINTNKENEIKLTIRFIYLINLSFINYIILNLYDQTQKQFGKNY